MTVILTYLVLYCSAITMHDFHVSKTELNYQEDQQAIQISVNIFIDDLELAIQSYTSNKLNLFNKSEAQNADSLIAVYIQENFKLITDQELPQLAFLGKEISNDLAGAWCYLEILNVNKFESIEIENTILLNNFEDQKNIIDFRINNKSKSFKILDNDNSVMKVKL